MTTSPLDAPRRAADRALHAHRRFGWLLRLRWVRVVLAVELVIALAVTYGLWTLRRQTLDGELQVLASLSAAMATQADTTLELADAALRATRDELDSGLLVPNTRAARDLLRRRTTTLPQFRALVVFDDAGRNVATSRSGDLPPDAIEPGNAAAIDGQAEAHVHVGRPIISRADGQPAIAVSMRWRTASGGASGIVALIAEPEFLDGRFERIAPTPDTSLAIYRRDRELVSDGPGDGSARLLPAAAMERLWTDAWPERPRLVVLPGGDERLVAAHRLQRHPLMVVVTRDATAALAGWSQQAWVVAVFAASALLVTLLLTLRNAREQALRKASQAALADEQARSARAVVAAREGHWEWNPATRETHLSARMRELLGADDVAPGAASDVGPLVRAGVHPDDLEPLCAAFEAHRQGRTPGFEHVFRVRQPDGQWRHVQARGHAWRDSGGIATLFSGTAADVTAEVEGAEVRARLERQLQRGRKLEALGTLAGGVAHDFNNILSAVLGYAELAHAAAQPQSRQARQLDEVMQAGLRGKALVERLLASGRGAPKAHAAVPIQPLVEEVLRMLAASLPANIALAPQLHAAHVFVSGEPTLIHEVTMNLCVNAVHAMPEGGTLRVDVRVDEVIDPRPIQDSTLAPGRWVCLAVADNGVGIVPDAMGRLFEPFFTTRAPGHGSGLGLAVVRGVVAELGGAIDVRSELGRGSCFSLYFPCVDAAPTPSPTSADATPQGRGQCILVVDDEPGLVALAEEMLASLGYEAFGVASGHAALACVREDPARFDLVLSDERMPGMSGTELARALHALRPGLPVVLASGWGGSDWQQRAAGAGLSAFVMKPLSRAQLASVVAHALDAPVVGPHGPAGPATTVEPIDGQRG